VAVVAAAQQMLAAAEALMVQQVMRLVYSAHLAQTKPQLATPESGAADKVRYTQCPLPADLEPDRYSAEEAEAEAGRRMALIALVALAGRWLRLRPALDLPVGQRPATRRLHHPAGAVAADRTMRAQAAMVPQAMDLGVVAVAAGPSSAPTRQDLAVQEQMAALSCGACYEQVCAN
jgi:hypothetical protein